MIPATPAGALAATAAAHDAEAARLKALRRHKATALARYQAEALAEIADLDDRIAALREAAADARRLAIRIRESERGAA